MKQVRPRASKSELSLNTTEESHTIILLSIQIDKYESLFRFYIKCYMEGMRNPDKLSKKH